MRISVTTKNGERTEGALALKDESFVMIKIFDNSVKVIHWEHIKAVKRVIKGDYQSINLDVFKKSRE